MAAIDNEIFPAVELTGMARAEAELLDSSGLARWLPNVVVDDIAVSFTVTADGTLGLTDEASYRAYDAEPDMGRGDEEGEEMMIKLPAISRQATISEYQQLRARNAGDGVLRRKIEQTMRAVVRPIVNRANSQRANVLLTGKATSNGKFRFNDDFGRDPALTTSVATPFTDVTASRLEALETLRDLYASKNGDEVPGCIALTRSGFSLLMRGDEFRPLLAVGGLETGSAISRPPTEGEVRGFLAAYGLPPIEIVTGIPDDTLLMLPAPGATTADEPNELGATYWGRTLASTEPEWEIAEEEQAGLIVGVFGVQGVPPIKFVVGDSISLPVMLNPNRSLAATIS